MGFAVVGNFEDAIGCWRTQADNWPGARAGRGIDIVLASAAGALGVRLGGAVAEDSDTADAAELGMAAEAGVDAMQRAVKLIWRALLLWLLLLLLLSFASLVGA